MTAGQQRYGQALFIGRFQPLHQEHLSSIQQALGQAEQLLICLGSSNMARSSRNPFWFEERQHMIEQSLSAVQRQRVFFAALPDFFDAGLWAQSVRQAAAQCFGTQARPALVGLEKDASSAYLRWFPEWPRLPIRQQSALSATQIRAALWQQAPLPQGVPQAVRDFLAVFARGPHFAALQAEWQALQQHRTPLRHEQRWVWQQGRAVWLRKRSEVIGHGLLAFPQRWLEAAPSAAPDELLDHGGRSLFGPTVTYVYYQPPPLAEGSFYDLEAALSQPRAFFEDHGVQLGKLAGQTQTPR